jgi:hypothetical protein
MRKGNGAYLIASLVQFLVHSHLDGRSRYEVWEGQLQGAGLKHCLPEIKSKIRSRLYSSELGKLAGFSLVRDSM